MHSVNSSRVQYLFKFISKLCMNSHEGNCCGLRKNNSNNIFLWINHESELHTYTEKLKDTTKDIITFYALVNAFVLNY